MDNYSEFKENRDCCRDYLTDEEYKSLSVIERNQLALDRYKKRPKSNWTVGMLYEMYIGHLLHDQYDVVQFGIINGVEDLLLQRKNIHLVRKRHTSFNVRIGLQRKKFTKM